MNRIFNLLFERSIICLELKYWNCNLVQFLFYHWIKKKDTQIGGTKKQLIWNLHDWQGFTQFYALPSIHRISGIFIWDSNRRHRLQIEIQYQFAEHRQVRKWNTPICKNKSEFLSGSWVRMQNSKFTPRLTCFCLWVQNAICPLPHIRPYIFIHIYTIERERESAKNVCVCVLSWNALCLFFLLQHLYTPVESDRDEETEFANTIDSLYSAHLHAATSDMERVYIYLFSHM